MKYCIISSEKKNNIKYLRMSSTAVLTGTLRVN